MSRIGKASYVSAVTDRLVSERLVEAVIGKARTGSRGMVSCGCVGNVRAVAVVLGMARQGTDRRGSHGTDWLVMAGIAMAVMARCGIVRQRRVWRASASRGKANKTTVGCGRFNPPRPTTTTNVMRGDKHDPTV